VTSIITALIAVLGSLAVAALPYLVQGVRTARIRKEIVELAEVRDKLNSDPNQQRVVTQLIEARMGKLVEVMSSPRSQGRLITGALVGVGTIAATLSAGAYMQHRANRAFADYIDKSTRLESLVLKGLSAVLKQPPDDATAKTVLGQFDPLLRSVSDSRQAYNTDFDWAEGLNYAALVLLALFLVSAIWITGRLGRRMYLARKDALRHLERAKEILDEVNAVSEEPNEGKLR